MNKKRIIYTGLLILVAVIVSIASFSYAYLTKVDEQHGKINVVVGTLKYRIDSNDLNNNSITVDEKTVLDIYVESLNDIASKYELYYTTDNSDVVVEYIDSDSLDPSSGEIDANERKHIQVRINTTNEATVVFGIKGGFVSNELTLDTNENSLIGVEIVLPPTITGGSNNWVAVSPVITISEEGFASKGVDHYEYYITQSATAPTNSNTATGTGNSAQAITDGTNYIYFRTVSTLGNKSEWSSSQIVKLDTLSPSTVTITASDAKASNTWHTSNFNLNFSATKRGASDITYYYGTNTNPSISGSSVSINTNSSTSSGMTYYVKACNAAGVCSVNSSYITKLDKNGPSLSNITNSSGGNWTNQQTIIKFNVVENGKSNIEWCYFKFTGESAWTRANSDEQPVNGVATYHYNAQRNTTTYIMCKDNAGNESNVLSTPIKTDLTAPVLSGLTNSSGGNLVNGPITVTFNVSESGGSNIEWCYYKYDGQTTWSKAGSNEQPVNGTATYTYSASRDTNTQIMCKDNAGNESNVLSTPIRIR